jgi:hypothetical protein
MLAEREASWLVLHTVLVERVDKAEEKSRVRLRALASSRLES